MPFDPNTPRSRDEVLLQAIVSGDSSAMGDPRDREEEFVKAIADKETLPDYSEASNGDVLQIGSDGPEWGAVPNELPAIAAGDAGKVLKVNSGETGTEWGEVSASSKYYEHHLTLRVSGMVSEYIYLTIISTSNTAFNASSLKDYVSQFSAVACSGFFTATVGNRGIIMNIFNSASNKCGRDMILMYQDSDDKTISITRDATQATPWTDYTITDNIKEI